jgi:hypothetical protein
MTNIEQDDERQKSDRRSFLEQCGRFAIVTPPVVTLMLATDSTKKALAASGTTVTVTTSATTTTATTTTVTLSMLEHSDDRTKSDLAMMMDSMGLMKPI